jgi:hypothetical protein
MNLFLARFRSQNSIVQSNDAITFGTSTEK